MEWVDCNEIVGPNHQCMNTVLQTLQEIEVEQDKQTLRLERLQLQAKNLLNNSALSKNLHMFRGIQHIGTGCSGCNETPIIGIRFKCKQCLNFELCSKCRDTISHYHRDFFILSASGTHDIMCDVCQETVGEIRYICRACNTMNFCHRCMVTVSHIHEILEIVLPLVISVDVFPKKNLVYARGEQAVVHIFVCNLSVQPVGSLTLKLTGGVIPFEFTPTFFDFSLNIGCKKTILIKGIISEAQGDYTATFRLFSETYQEWVGKDIILNIRVTVDYLEGLRQSLSL